MQNTFTIHIKSHNKCLVNLLAVILFMFGCSLSFAWSGVIVDKDAAQPISKSVIVRSWERGYATPGGMVHYLSDLKETLSNEDGNFSIIDWKWRFYIPILTSVKERKTIVYKPGYKFLIIDKKESIIKLEKIPTVLNLRKQELETAERNYATDYYKTHIFLDMLLKEEEFLGINHFSSEDRGSERNYKQEVRQRAGVLPPPSAVTIDGHELGEADFKKWMNTFKNDRNAVDTHALNNLIKYVDHAADFLMASLHDDDWRIRKEAAYLLAYVNNQKVIDALIAVLNDDNNQVIRNAVFALGEQRDPRAINALIRVFQNQDQEVRYRAADALRKIRDPRALDGLVGRLHDPSSKVRVYIVEALGVINDVRSVESIINCWHDDNQEVRVTAANILPTMGPIALDPLIARTLHEDPYFRWRAARALGKFKDSKAVIALISLLNDDISDVKWSAIEALGNIRDDQSIEPLLPLLNDSDSGIKAKAEEALTKMKTKKSQDRGRVDF